MMNLRTTVAALAKNPDALLDELNPDSVHLWHMATGVAGEVIEFMEALRGYISVAKDARNEEEWKSMRVTRRAHLIEEMGDIFFYCEGIRAALGLRNPTHEAGLVDETGLGILTSAGELLDSAKKHAVYSKPLSDEQLDAIQRHLDIIHTALIETIGSLYNATYEEVMEALDTKLNKKRYPNGYTNEAAQARADKKEGDL